VPSKGSNSLKLVQGAFMEFKHCQALMANYLRDPDNSPAPEGIEERRLKIYRELIYNNIEGFVASAFPVLRETYQDEPWHALVRAFIKSHHCESPYFLQISEEFMQFLQTDFVAGDSDPGFMLELAHYEWVELALDGSTASLPDTVLTADQTAQLTPADLLQRCINVSPLAWPLSYQYPVHQISAGFQPEGVSNSANFFVVYRQSEEVRFLEANAATVRLLNLLSEQVDSSLRNVLDQLANEMQLSEKVPFFDFALGLVARFLEMEIVYIYR
jgi:hypothetical protein